MIRMPMMPVMRPPVLKSMRRGHMLAKSFAGETTLAAMLTEMVATMTVNIEMATTHTFWNSPTRATGSQWALPKTIADAEVMTTPIAAKAVIVVGRPMTWPHT